MPEGETLKRFPERSLRDIYYVLFRHKGKVIFFFLGVVAVVTLVTFWLPEIYRAEAKLLVRIGRESVSLDPTATTGQIISIGQSRESEINSELEILKSRELAQKVVDAMGPQIFLKKPDPETPRETASMGALRDRLPEIQRIFRGVKEKIGKFLEDLDLTHQLSDRERAVIQLMGNLNIEAQKNNNILFLSYEAQSPNHAQNVLNRLIDYYLDKHIAAHRTAGSFEFFDRQTEELKRQVSQREEELRNLKNRTGVASLEDQRRILLSRIGASQQDMEATQAALAISQAKIKEIRERLVGLSQMEVTQETTGTANQGADMMRSTLYGLQLKEQELLSKFTETSQTVREIRRQIAEAQALLAKEEPTRAQVTRGINSTYQQLNLMLLTEMAALSSLKAKEQVVRGQLAVAQKDLQDLNNTEVQMVNLQRELGLQEATYRKYAENREQARIDQALETKKISNISVVQPASASLQPIRPRKRVNLGLGLLLGTLGGVGLAFFSEYLDHSIKTPQDIEEKLGIPLLASIPRMKKGDRKVRL